MSRLPWRSLRAPVVTGVILFLVALAFTAINWKISAKTGRLSTVPTYDDVVYLHTASEIYFQARKEGWGAAVGSLFSGYLHSPFTIANALVGFVLFGANVKAVYFMLTAVIFTYVFFIAVLARKLPPIFCLAIVLFGLAFPFATTAATQFKPDPMWTVFLGAGSVLFLVAERPFDGWRGSLFYGLALAAALLTKPSTFAMTLLVMGGTWLLAAAAAGFSGRASWLGIARGLGITVLCTLVVTGWYLIPHSGTIFAYFYDNSFGENREVWLRRSDLWDRLTYYVRGIALYSNLGGFIFPLLFAYVVGATHDLWSGADRYIRIRGGAFLWMLAALFVVNSFFTLKNPYLGGSFYGFVIFGGLWQLVRFLRWGIVQGWWQARRRQALTAVAILCLGASGYSYSAIARVSPEVRTAYKTINRGILRDLLAESKGKSGVSVLFTQGTPVIWEFIDMEFRARGKTLRSENSSFATDSASVLESAARTDFIILQDQDIVGSPWASIPGGKLQPELIAAIGGSPDWHLLGRYSDSEGKFAYLYKNLRAPR